MLDLLEAAVNSRGAYGIAEAARYLHMPAATLRRWFLGDAKNAAIHQAGIDEQGVSLLTFDDFVEAAAVKCLRFEHQVPLQKIRAAYDKARSDYGIERFFSLEKHRIFKSSSGELLICVDDEDPLNPVHLTGKACDQREFHLLAQAYLRQIEWDEKGVANRWVAYHFGPVRIVMCPGVSFGEPVLEKAGYPAETIYDAFLADADRGLVAESFGITLAEVDAACQFMTSLSPAA